MKRMAAIGDTGTPGRAARELDRGLDRLGSGIGEEGLVEMRHEREQPFGEDAGEHRDIHLHQVGQIGIERAFQRLANHRMTASDRKHPEAAQQVKITRVLPIVEILTASLAESNIIADRPQYANHLLIETFRMQAKAVSFMGVEQSRDVDGRPQFHAHLFPVRHAPVNLVEARGATMRHSCRNTS